MRLTTNLTTVSSSMMLVVNESAIVFEIDNDYLQNQIYNEVRRNNSFLELWRHVFGILGCLISLFGIVGKIMKLPTSNLILSSIFSLYFCFTKGNILSIIILLKPASSNDKFSKYLLERPHSQIRRSLGSFEHRLASFYAYLTALSFCDLFSCIFAILNMLEYIPPPYMDCDFERYREFLLSISVYTHPIATTLQVSLVI